MAEITLKSAPMLGGVDHSIAGNRIVERVDLALVSVAVPAGGEAALAASLQTGWSLEMPAPTLSTVSGDSRAIRTAPDQIFLLFPHDASGANNFVQTKLDGTGYTTDQTSGWVILDVSGPDTLAALERICPIDLHAKSFPVDASARTMMEHMGAMVIRLETERFLLLSASSSAGSFLHAVETSFHYVQP